jgi:lysophospholipase L1-like esterase
VRGSSLFDGFVVLESTIADPADPSRMRPDLDSGDHIHPNAAGNRVMGNGIDIAPFLPRNFSC